MNDDVTCPKCGEPCTFETTVGVRYCSNAHAWRGPDYPHARSQPSDAPHAPVWVVEEVLDHAPGWIRGVFSTCELAIESVLVQHDPNANWRITRGTNGAVSLMSGNPASGQCVNVEPHKIDAGLGGRPGSGIAR